MSAEFFNNWTHQIRKGLLELIVLNDIFSRGTYAYDMEREFCRSCGLLLGKGRMYSILARLRRQRLVKAVQARSPHGPRRKYYELTATGRQTLAQMNAYWQAIQQQAHSIEENG